MDADTTNCPWNAVAASKITIQYDATNSNAAVDGDTKAAAVATAVDNWLKTQTGYATGFTVTAKSPVSIIFDTSAGKATVTLQVAKTGDATPTDVNVTVLAVDKDA